MKAYYFHGLNSRLKSRKANFLREYFRSYFIDLHEIDLNIPNNKDYKLESIVNNSISFISKTSTSQEKVILIGSSFGCYVIMNLLNKIMKIKAFKLIFLSPVFDLKNTSLYQNEILDRNVVNYYLKSYDETIIRIKDDMNFFEVDFKPQKPLLIIHGSEDEVISSVYTENYIESISSKYIQYFLIKSNHRLTKNFEEVMLKIDKFLFQFDGFRIITFDYSNILFQNWKVQFLEILRRSYKKRYFGNQYHIKKIQSRKVRLFLVFDHENGVHQEKKLIAGSYVSPDGKHLAIGVLPEYRRKGIGLSILQFSRNFYDFQYAEVEDTDMRYVLEKADFEQIRIIRKVKEILGSERTKLINKFIFDKGELIYMRKSSELNGEFKFRLMCYKNTK